ncbi:Serine/threonine-protein kinase PknD [Gimesia alba]|uniref:Serine/threonine-protein kinase PknD n=1 Tax=Gimesia alba TaxID=2527973 RepID=A0A517RHZ5_9PLAN|nr:serine/threonine-protein kinase [Gimesia alba]QDT43493.1 Serine/threonine-protein kinase PknD [Gimesia alba]
MNDRAHRLEELFEAVLDRPNDERDKFLAEACGDDTSLRDEVLTLVRHHEASNQEGFFEPLQDGVGDDVAEGSDRYKLLKEHASGSLGKVFLARDREFDRDVAWKQIQESRADDPLCQRRFTMEAKITGKLEHPGIVPVYSKGVYGENMHPFYTMKFIDGETMKSAIDRLYGASVDNMEWKDGLRSLLRRFIDVCHAIDYAHSRGVVHRDIKPANVVLGKFGETMVVDWGIAKLIDSHEESALGPEETLHLRDEPDASATRTGSYLGTPGYMSPEQATGRTREIGPWSDIFGLGAMLYHILTGKLPYEGRDSRETLLLASKGKFKVPRKVNKKVPFRLQLICEKAMAIEPTERYNSAGELAKDVEYFLEDRALIAKPDTWAEKFGRYYRRKPIIATTLLIMLTTNIPVILYLILGDKENLPIGKTWTEIWMLCLLGGAIGIGMGQATGISLGIFSGLAELFRIRTGGTIGSRLANGAIWGFERGVILGSVTGAYLFFFIMAFMIIGADIAQGLPWTSYSLFFAFSLIGSLGVFILIGSPVMAYLWFTNQADRIWPMLGYLCRVSALFLCLLLSFMVVRSPSFSTSDASLIETAGLTGSKLQQYLQTGIGLMSVGVILGYLAGGFSGGMWGLRQGKATEKMIVGSRAGMCILGTLIPLVYWALMFLGWVPAI